MKILYGITKSNFGGAQRYVFELATEMKRQGHDVAVICGAGELLVEKLKENGVRVIEVEGLKRDISLVDEFRSFHFIFRTLYEEKPDVFHINSSKMGGLGALAGRLVGIKKIIFTAHGWAFNELRPMWQKVLIKFLAWITILLSHKTICVSEKSREDMSNWPFTKNKMVVIYNGIKEFKLALREEKDFTVGTIAELHRIKGLDILLKAWSKFIKKHPAKLVIIGEGEERRNLENMARRLNISDSVEFRGHVDNAREKLLNFDIFVLSSRSENLPYVVLEAGLAGLSVIATSVGGVPEIVESGTNGVLVPAENAEVLFSTLVLLAEDENLRQRLGTNLRASVIENFSLKKMVNKTSQLYNLGP